MKSFFELQKKKRLRQKGQKLLVKGKIEKAYSIFQRDVLLDDSHENLFNLALALMSLHKYPEAEEYLQKVYEKLPSNEMNLLTLAECSMMQQKWEQAIKLYEELSAYNPRNESYQNYLNLSQDIVAREKYVKSKQLFNAAARELTKKNDEKALKILLEAEEYYPENPNILNNIGSIFLLLKQYKQAYDYFIRAMRFDANNLKIKKNVLIARKKLK
ncbi:MAG: tetratricopeptide repeat protein [Candidatus Cloacimonadales bacterium]|nr:tetratricopeptide repeat protein [Candidatus Cloacimonadales bacterium]